MAATSFCRLACKQSLMVGIRGASVAVPCLACHNARCMARASTPPCWRTAAYSTDSAAGGSVQRQDMSVEGAGAGAATNSGTVAIVLTGTSCSGKTSTARAIVAAAAAARERWERFSVDDYSHLPEAQPEWPPAQNLFNDELDLSRPLRTLMADAVARAAVDGLHGAVIDDIDADIAPLLKERGIHRVLSALLYASVPDLVSMAETRRVDNEAEFRFITLALEQFSQRYVRRRGDGAGQGHGTALFSSAPTVTVQQLSDACHARRYEFRDERHLNETVDALCYRMGLHGTRRVEDLSDAERKQPVPLSLAPGTPLPDLIVDDGLRISVEATADRILRFLRETQPS